MNILILNWRDPNHPFAGGAEISLFEHAKYWRKLGADITWFSSSFDNAKKKENISGINILRHGSHFTVHLFAFWFLRREKLGVFDVIIDSFHFIPFFTPLYIKRGRIIALVNEVAGRLWFTNLPFPVAFLGYCLESLFLKLYKKHNFITSSESTHQELINYGIPKANICIVYHGVNIRPINKKRKKEKDPTILFLNRISKDKGIEDTLKTFKILKEKVKNVKLWIVGKEEKKRDLDRFIINSSVSNLKPYIHYFGFVSEEKKFELLRRAWVLVHPSVKEGWGLTVIEAASQGTPTVGYNVEGLRDSIINGKTGILTSVDPYALAKAMLELINGKNLYRSMSIAGKKWAKKFSWDKSTKESFGIIQRVKRL